MPNANLDLFTAVHPEERLHPQFKYIRDSPLHEPARAMLREIVVDFHDPDGNFVEQFQTTGFDQRTFELYLYALFRKAGLEIDRSHDRPDYIVGNGEHVVCVEAVTANPSTGFTPYNAIPEFRSREELNEYLSNEVPIRFGSPLFSKLGKRYWELPHVVGKPLVLAVESFHGPGSLALSYSHLTQYLYGLGQSWHLDPQGHLVITSQPLDEHRVGDKVIPSGFFYQPNSEHISAVLFSNSGTIPKFFRMGQQGPFRSNSVRVFRFGTCYSYVPNATEPEVFLYEVGKESHETWREGTMLIHNPSALHPVSRGFLGVSSETRLENGQAISTFIDEFHPYTSLTMPFIGEESENRIETVLTAILEALESGRPSLY